MCNLITEIFPSIIKEEIHWHGLCNDKQTIHFNTEDYKAILAKTAYKALQHATESTPEATVNYLRKHL